jgi:ribosome-interacting GTPase 1
MPANLPPEAKAKWRKVMEARSPEEKLQALQEFLSTVPKHKGTERLRMHVTRQIAALRREIEEKRKRRGGGGEQFFVEKEGDVQVVLLGLQGCGKSQVFSCLTGVTAPEEPRKPVPGSWTWEGVYFQVVNPPPLLGEAEASSRVIALARNADALIIVVNSRGDVEYQFSAIVSALEAGHVTLSKPRGVVTIERRASGGVVLVGQLIDATLDDVASLLRSYGIYHAVVKVEGEATLDTVEEALFGAPAYKPAVLFLTGGGGSAVKSPWDIPVVEFTTCESLDKGFIARYFLQALDLIRVYTRNPKTGEVEKRPIVVKRGTRVIEIAKLIHSDLYKSFKHAKVWSTRFEFSPRRVGRDFVLEDGDVVEIVA